MLPESFESIVSTFLRSFDEPVARTMVTGPVALVQVSVKVEPGVRENSELVKKGVAVAVAARAAKTDATENFILTAFVDYVASGLENS